MTIALITPPALEPLALEEVKLHLRVDHDHEDQLLADTLKAARQHAELASGQKFLTQVWRQYESGYPAGGEVMLEVSPVQTIDAVTIFDRQGTPRVLTPEEYDLQRGADPAALRLCPSLDPAAARNGLEIDMVAGTGDQGVDVPDTLKRAILMLVAHWYEFRGAVLPCDQPVSLPPGFEALMRPWRRARL